MVKETCFYCRSSAHNILECPRDAPFVTSLLKDCTFPKKNYNGLEKRMLRRLIYVFTRTTPSSMHNPLKEKPNKNQLITMVKHLHGRHAGKRKERLLEISRKKKASSQEECPVCYEELGDRSCTLLCNHKVCNQCYPRLWMHEYLSPKCPMCRMSQVPSRVESTSR